MLVCVLQICILESNLPFSEHKNPITATSTDYVHGEDRLSTSNSWAYVFLLADCDPSQPFPAYRGLLYNIIAATYVLKYDNSHMSTRADILVMVQLSYRSPMVALLPTEEALLRRMGIHCRYLSKPTHKPTFYELVKAKFQLWDLFETTQYTKLLFLDGDVLPFCNLDYLLENSAAPPTTTAATAVSSTSTTENTIPRLRSTVLHAMYEDPVNAGLFVLSKPDPIAKQKQPYSEALEYWNETTKQWGSIPASAVDYRLWDGTSGSGWDFYCGNTDQGFLLYWSRFIQQDVSIIVGSTIEHYYHHRHEDNDNSETQRGSSIPQKSITSSKWMANHTCLPPFSSSPSMGRRQQTYAQNSRVEAASLPFYQDFFHMVGYSKAWESRLRRNPLPWNKDELHSSQEYWYFIVRAAQEQFDPHHQVIPPIESIFDNVGKPPIRGDLFTVGTPTNHSLTKP